MKMMGKESKDGEAWRKDIDKHTISDSASLAPTYRSEAPTYTTNNFDGYMDGKQKNGFLSRLASLGRTPRTPTDIASLKQIQQHKFAALEQDTKRLDDTIAMVTKELLSTEQLNRLADSRNQLCLLQREMVQDRFAVVVEQAVKWEGYAERSRAITRIRTDIERLSVELLIVPEDTGTVQRIEEAKRRLDEETRRWEEKMRRKEIGKPLDCPIDEDRALYRKQTRQQKIEEEKKRHLERTKKLQAIMDERDRKADGYSDRPGKGAT